MTPIHVLLVDDHHLIRLAVRQALAGLDDIEIVAEADDGQEALRHVPLHRPDVVLADIDMPDLDGLSLTAQLARDFPAVRVLLLSGYTDQAHVVAGVQAGAAGYLPKDIHPDELAQAVRTVANGGKYFSPAISHHLAAAIVKPTPPPAPTLTPQQLNVLERLARGHSNKQIARLMGISHSTVEHHRSELMKRLKIKHIPGLVRYAIKIGLVKLDE